MTTILIVEGDPVSREMLSHVLGFKGYRVLAAADGEAAVALARAEQPDLVMTEAAMPRMDGLELVRQVRDESGHPVLPAIFFTSATPRTPERKIVESFPASRVLGDSSGPLRVLQVVEDMVGPPKSPSIPPASGRRDAAAPTRISEERSRLLVENARDSAIVMLDPQGDVMTWNAGATEITGWRPEEMVGRNLSVLFPRDEAGAALARRTLEIAVGTGEHRVVSDQVRKDGSRFWADVTVTAVRDEEGQLRGFAQAIRDISERKRAEDERERSRQGLRRLVDA
jgi:PAS domain S-box-containing protein